MSNKIKLDLGADFTVNDAPPKPFECAVCGVKRHYHLLLHDGKSKVCSKHYAANPVGAEASMQINWRDMWQINAAAAVLREIKNATKH